MFVGFVMLVILSIIIYIAIKILQLLYYIVFDFKKFSQIIINFFKATWPIYFLLFYPVIFVIGVPASMIAKLISISISDPVKKYKYDCWIYKYKLLYKKPIAPQTV